MNPRLRIRNSILISKDSFRGFVSWIRFVDLFKKICFVDSFRGFVFERFVLWIRFVKKKNQITRFVSFRFVRIRVRIPHPYFKAMG
jgi:hypothetical protein